MGGEAERVMDNFLKDLLKWTVVKGRRWLKDETNKKVISWSLSFKNNIKIQMKNEKSWELTTKFINYIHKYLPLRL